MQDKKDALTGLYNRKFGDVKFDDILSESEKNGRPFGVVLLDLDYFKKFNDTYGHREGDELLRRIAPVMSGIVDEQGFAMRYGGDEFLILLPGFTKETTREMAEELRSAIEKTTVEIDEKIFCPVTATLGFALYPLNGKNWEALIRSADESLIYGKRRTSRNCVVFNKISGPDL